MTEMTSDERQDFADLLSANREYARSTPDRRMAGVAKTGVAIVTCMDSRIDPLPMLGLGIGDAKIFRNPGGQVDDAALEALVLGVNLLGARRVLIVPHTRCAMASKTADQLRAGVSAACGVDASSFPFHVIDDQVAALRRDVEAVRAHPLIPERIVVGGFVYDVDTGLLDQVV